MATFVDEKEQRPENRVRRERMLEIFKAAMLNPQENLCVPELAGLVRLENVGYILGFILVDLREPVDYDRTLVAGDYADQSVRDNLWCTELYCQEGRDGLNSDSPIPVLVLNKYTAVECIVLDQMPLSIGERDKVTKGLNDAKDVLKNMMV
jgi:hypothetical protein